jgi:hypothetical protein
MTNSTDMQIRGKAVYLEFIKNGMTQQVLLLPEGVSTSHKTVPMTVFRRRLSTVQPRKTWKAAAASYTAASLLTGGTPVARTEVPDQVLSFIYPLMTSLRANGYVLYKDPIVVEVTAEDLELARLGKTPYKAMARVWKARKKLGFPKEYIHPVAAPVAAPAF